MTDTIKPRWYVICTEGLATLCATEGDALTVKAHADIGFPRRGPHRAVQLVDAASVRDEIDRLRAALTVARALVFEVILENDNESGFLMGSTWSDKARAALGE